MTLERAGRRLGAGRFRLDLLSLSEEALPQIEGAVDLPNALSHLASLPALFLRVMLKLHLWDFRAPDYRNAADPKPGLDVPSVEFPPGRTLQAETHDFDVPRGSLTIEPKTIRLRLTRFRTSKALGNAEDAQGTPVLLLHGYAQSSRAFAADMLPEDLIRHLLGRNFDVWLLDYRTSTALPTAREQCSLDDVARYDIPGAVDFILGKVAHAQVMALGHCMGAATLAMSLLAGWLKHESGLPKISALILSQVPPFIVGGYYSQYRRALAAFGRNVLGLEHIQLAADSSAGPWEKLMDRVFATLPVAVEHEPYGEPHPEDCRSIEEEEPRTDIATCRRVSGIIGPLYLHQNMHKTHRHLDQWFGLGSISILAHVAKFFQYERLVSADGSNFYVTDANIFTNLRLPIGLLHGNRNQVFDPESAQRSCEAINRVRGSGACEILDIAAHDYAHFDCLAGDNAHRDVFPKVSRFFLKQLNAGLAEIRSAQRPRSYDPEPLAHRTASEARPASRLDR
jgi:cholesterol oxidase